MEPRRPLYQEIISPVPPAWSRWQSWGGFAGEDGRGCIASRPPRSRGCSARTGPALSVICTLLLLSLFFFSIDRFELSSHYISYWKLFWQISYRKDPLLKDVPNSCWTPGIELVPHESGAIDVTVLIVIKRYTIQNSLLKTLHNFSDTLYTYIYIWIIEKWKVLR